MNNNYATSVSYYYSNDTNSYHPHTSGLYATGGTITVATTTSYYSTGAYSSTVFWEQSNPRPTKEDWFKDVFKKTVEEHDAKCSKKNLVEKSIIDALNRRNNGKSKKELIEERKRVIREEEGNLT